MPQTVEIPDHGIAEFPDDMTPDQIKGVIQSKFYASPTPAATPQSGEIAPPVIADSGYVGRGEFAPTSGSESAPLTSRESPQEQAAQQGPLANLATGVTNAFGKMIPTSLEQVKQMTTLPRVGNVDEQLRQSEELGAQWRGERGPVAQAESITGTVLQALPLAGVLFGKSPLRPSAADLNLVNQLRNATSVPNAQSGTTAPSLTQTLFGKEPDPLTAAVNEGLTESDLKYAPPDLGKVEPVAPQEVLGKQEPVAPNLPTGTGEVLTGINPVSEPITPIEYSAIRDESNGEVYDGRNHAEILAEHFPDVSEENSKGKFTFGFLDESGNFLNRDQAWERARRFKQVERDLPPRPGTPELYHADISRKATKEPIPSPVSEAPVSTTASSIPKTEETAVTPETPPTEPPVEPPTLESSVPSTPGSMTGLSKDFISKDRAERGEEPLSQQARIGNEETWDKAGQQFSANPNVGHELVQSLTETPRALTQDDLGVLLRHRVNLTNETEFNAEIANNPDTPLPQKAEALQRLAALQDARNSADQITRAGGSQTGRTMQFLQQLATQDYSLSSLLQQRRAARGGKPFSPETSEAEIARTQKYSDDILKADQEWQNYLKEGKREESALKAYKTRLQGATTEYERRLAFSDFEPALRREMQLDQEALQLKSNFEKARDNFQKQLFKDSQANKPLWMKLLQGASYVAREGALSGLSTLGKLAAFTGAKLGEIPLTETAERVWGQIPGFRELSKTSEFGPGANAKQLGTFYKEFFTTGMKEAWNMLTGKGSPTRQALEKEKRFTWPSFFGNLHGVEKTPLLIASQRMNRLKLLHQEMEKLSSEAVARGQDITDPLTQGAINYKAFQKATYDILQEQIEFASWVNRGLDRMESVKKATGEVNATQAVLANLAKIFLTKGIIRVPANYFKQTLERTPLGLARGAGGAARAWYKGVENVTPAERTAIMKLMGVGSVGSGFFLWGALDALKPPEKRTFGGYYQPHEDREKTNDVHFGAIRLADKTIPHLFTHNPMTESAQMGSTLMRVATSLISKKDQRNKGLIEGAIRSVFGLAEQAPISGQAFRLSKIGEPSGPTSVVGEAVRGLIPQLVQNFAQWTDKDTKRKPTTIMESIKMGIPGLRQTVPEGGKKASNVSRRR